MKNYVQTKRLCVSCRNIFAYAKNDQCPMCLTPTLISIKKEGVEKKEPLPEIDLYQACQQLSTGLWMKAPNILGFRRFIAKFCANSHIRITFSEDFLEKVYSNEKISDEDKYAYLLETIKDIKEESKELYPFIENPKLINEKNIDPIVRGSTGGYNASSPSYYIRELLDTEITILKEVLGYCLFIMTLTDKLYEDIPNANIKEGKVNIDALAEKIEKLEEILFAYHEDD